MTTSCERRDGLQDEPSKPNKQSPGLNPPSSNGKDKNSLPNILLCFKHKTSKPGEKYKDKKVEEAPSKSKNDGKKRSKSRELRAGILYVGCDCERRNGLQDHCPRSGCQGAPECMTFPPTCPPSEFAQNKHNVKIYEKLAKERAEFAKRMREKAAAGPGGGSDNKSSNKQIDKKNDNAKVDYDCFPLDEMMKDGAPCPLCDRPMDGCSDKHKPREVVVGPIIIDFDPNCICPGAS